MWWASSGRRHQRRAGAARADIGISVDTAVDIAKEAADIILLEKSLMVLADGVREGGARPSPTCSSTSA